MFSTFHPNPLPRLIAIAISVTLIIALLGFGLWYIFRPVVNQPVETGNQTNLVAKLNGVNTASLDFNGTFKPEVFYYNTINKDNWLLHIPSSVTNKAYIQTIINQLNLQATSPQGYYPVIYNLSTKSYKLADKFLGTGIIGQKLNVPLFDKDRSREQLVKLIDTGKNWVYSLTDGSIFYSGTDFKDAQILLEQVYTDKDNFTINQLLDITSTEIILLARKQSLESLFQEAQASRSQVSSSINQEEIGFGDDILYSDTILKLPIDKTFDGAWRSGLGGLNSIWTEVPLAGANAWQQKAKADYNTRWQEFKFEAGINKLTPDAKSVSSSSGEVPLPAFAQEYHPENYFRVDVLASGRLFVHIAGAKNYFWLVDGQTGQNINTEFGTPQSWDHTMTSSCDKARSVCKIVNLNDSLVYNLDASSSGKEYTFGSAKLEAKGLDIKSMEYTTRYRIRTLKESLSNFEGGFGFWQLGDWIKVG